MSSIRKKAAKYVTLAILTMVGVEHFSHEAQPVSRGEAIPGIDHIQGPTLAEIPRSQFVRGQAEPALSYISRVTHIVHDATYSCAPTDNSVSLIERVANSVADKLGYDPRYEFGLFNFRTLRCGFCSERAAAATRILRDNGMEAITYGIIGHVISRITVDEKVYFTDPDYGVGPYPADLDFVSVQKIYEHSVTPHNAKLLATIVTEQSGDAPYFSEEYISNLRDIRRWIHYISNGAASSLIALALCLGFWRRESRSN